jgi:hypothetical protein
MVDITNPAYSLIYRSVWDASEKKGSITPIDGSTIFPDVYVTNELGIIGFSRHAVDSSPVRGLGQLVQKGNGKKISRGNAIMLIAPGDNVADYLRKVLDETNRDYEFNEGYKIRDSEYHSIITRNGAFILTADDNGPILKPVETNVGHKYDMDGYRRRLGSRGIIPRRIDEVVI